MKKLKIIILVVIISLSSSNVVLAKISNISTKIESNKTEIGLTEPLEITINTEYEGKLDLPKNPEQNEKDGGNILNLNYSELPEIDLGGIENFQISNKFQTQKSINLNGKQKTQIILKYILIPKKIGDFTLGPINLLENGQIIGSKNKETKNIKVIEKNEENINIGATNNTVNPDEENQINPEQIETDKGFDFGGNLLYILIFSLLIGLILLAYIYFSKQEGTVEKKEEKQNNNKKEINKENVIEMVTKELDKYLEKKAGKSLEGHDIYSKLSFEEDENQRKVLEFLYSKINEYKYSGKKLDEDAIKEEIMKLGVEFFKKIF